MFEMILPLFLSLTHCLSLFYCTKGLHGSFETLFFGLDFIYVQFQGHNVLNGLEGRERKREIFRRL